MSGVLIGSVPSDGDHFHQRNATGSPTTRPTTDPWRFRPSQLSHEPPPAASTLVGGKFSQSASCLPGTFTSRTGSALVLLVKTSSLSCINTLFSITDKDAYRTFRQSQMLTIAGAYKTAARRYLGNNRDGIQQLALFLRVGYYMQSTSSAGIGSYTVPLTSAVTSGLDAFFDQPHSRDVTAANGDVLTEMITLTDSIGQQGRYLDVYQRLLHNHDDSYDSIASMVRAVHEVYRPLWRGNWNPTYVKALEANPRIIKDLYRFALANTQRLGTDLASLDTNAGRNLARYAGHAGLQATVRPLAKALLHKTAANGPTAGLWVAVASQVASYDGENCAYYNICDLARKVTDSILPASRQCDQEVTIRAQALSSTDLDSVCADVLRQSVYFRDLLNVDGEAANRHAAAVQLVIFASFAEYQTYASALYGIDTNNGGKTLTGNPNDPANYVISIMYQKESNDDFVAQIWNLNHEFTHFLDTRYDMKGDFSQQTSVPDGWWIEGLAEYVSYSYRRMPYSQAIQEAGKHTFRLSDLFENNAENSDQIRTYQWGYLAVRYMLEQHLGDVQRMLSRFRVGDYAGGYAIYHDGIGSKYDADFDRWLTACATGSCAKTPEAWSSRTTPPPAGESAVDDTSQSTQTLPREHGETIDRPEGQDCRVGVFGGCVFGE
ncbi:collagenase [Streptomyces sp. 900105245]